MDLCLMLGLCYLADVSGRASVDFSPGFPRNTLGPGGFILQTAATTRRSGYQLAHDRANQQFYTTLFRSERTFFIHQLQYMLKCSFLCISQQSYKRWMTSYRNITLIQYGTKAKTQRQKQGWLNWCKCPSFYRSDGTVMHYSQSRSLFPVTFGLL